MIRRFTVLFISILTAFFSLSSRSESVDTLETTRLNFQLLTIDNGLSQGMITDMDQDINGFIWIGTKDGLNRYDGYTFKVYRHDINDSTTLSDNFITSILADSRGWLWIQYTNSQMDLFDPVKEKVYHVSKKYPALTIKQGVFRRKMICYKDDVYILDRNSLVRLIVKKDGPQSEPDFKIICENYTQQMLSLCRGAVDINPYICNDGRLLIMTNDSVFVYNDIRTINNRPDIAMGSDTFHQFSIRDIESDTDIVQGEDSVNNLLAIQKGQLLTVMNTKTLKPVFQIHFTKQTNLYIKNISFDKKGRMWMVCFEGLLLYDPRTKKLSNVLPTTPNINEDVLVNTNFTFIDPAGVIWIGTTGYGLLRYNMNVERFHHILGNGKMVTQGIWEEDDGSLLLKNILQYQIYSKDKDELWSPLIAETNPKTSKLKKGDKIVADGILPVHNGYWLLVEPYICFLDKNFVFRKVMRSPKIKNPYIAKSFQSKNGSVWMAASNDNENVLHLLNERTDTVEKSYWFPIQKSTVWYPFTSDIKEDTKGDLWIGTVEGLFRFDPKKESWTHFKNKPNDSTSLPLNVIFSLCNDNLNKNILWIGTNGAGLVRFDRETGKCIQYDHRIGLPNNVIYGILPDKKNNLWLSTNKGLARFNPATKDVKTFTVRDGLQSNEFNRYSYCQLHDGKLAFGGMNGLNIFDPEEIEESTFQPHVNFTGFRIGNVDVPINSSGSAFEGNFADGGTIRLDHTSNFITFTYASSDYTATDKIQYSYILEGQDQNWMPATKLNEATYTNLYPGTYHFKIKSTNSDGVWSPHSSTITVIIDPPWWGTWWFRSFAVLMVAIAIYGLYRYRLREALKLLSLRNRIASDLHDEIGSTLSSISLYSEAAKQMMQGNKEAEKVLNRINSNTTEMMEAMSDIVWAINSKNDQLDNVVNRMRSFAVQVSEARQFNLHFAENKDLPNMPLDMYERKNLYLIFKEAVNNAAKYSSCNNLWISFINKNNILEMKVKDDGKGFIYPPSDDSAVKRGGNGLLNMQKRASDLGGTIMIHSKIDKGTEIILKIHLDK